MLTNILTAVGADTYQLWFSDTTENNYRTQIYPEYKANRNQPKPKHYDLLKEYMIREWEARIAMNQEADDMLGIEQRFYLDNGGHQDYGYGETIICTIDKDLLQIPGLHYNFVKNEFQEVTPYEGIRYFYNQVLTGDSTDNIRGCIQIGPVKAAQALLGKGTEGELYAKVVELYLNQHAIYKPEMSQDTVIEYLITTARVLKIRQIEDEPLWNPPIIKESSNQDQFSEAEGQTVSTENPRPDYKHISELN